MTMNRRDFLATGSAVATMALAAPALAQAKPRVVVVGGGPGGVTAAKYIAKDSQGGIEVVLVEPQRQFTTCFHSNLYLGGYRSFESITHGYDKVSAAHGFRMNHQMASRVDREKKEVLLADGSRLGYDRLVLSPGIDLKYDSVPGWGREHEETMPHAWRAGPQTQLLKARLDAVPDGGVIVMIAPPNPYRCPPGPYERASVIAGYFKAAKPRSKVLILDANPDVTSKGPLFKKVWAEQYKGIVEYRGQHKATAVDAKAGVIKFDVQDDVKANVINALPTMRAGAIAVQSGLNNMANNRWCGVNYQTFESTAAKDVFVLGDSIQIAPAMPKSGHMANSHGKVAAAAIVAQLSGWEINPAPMLTNTCYSFVDNKNVVHVASVHEYVAAEKTFKTVAGSGGVSPGPTELEGVYALNWASNIWADTLI